MNKLESDIEIAADGSIRLLSPLPEWLKPGRAHVVLTLADPYRDIGDPVEWQCTVREDVIQPGRE